MKKDIIDRITDLFADMKTEDFLFAYNCWSKIGLYQCPNDLTVFAEEMTAKDLANALEKSNFRADKPFFTVSGDYVFNSCYIDEIPNIDKFSEFAYDYCIDNRFESIFDELIAIKSENEGWETEEKELQSYWYNTRV